MVPFDHCKKKQSPEREEIKVGREALVKDMKW
jgi:hypothetical protein